MDQEKPKTHNTLADTLKDSGNKEFARQGEEVFKASPQSESSSKAEIRAASSELVTSTTKIVDALMVVIGAVDTQNTLQRQNHESERLMMGLLEAELQETRRDNQSTRHLIWACIGISVISMASQIFLIVKNYHIFQYHKKSVEEVSTLLDQSYKAITATQINQTLLKQSIEQKPTVTVIPNEKKGSADIEIKQAVTTDEGNVEYDVVKIPLSLKGAQVRTSAPEEPKKSPTAEQFNEVMSK